MKYGRADDEWGELVSAATHYLGEVAKISQVTTYTELSSQLARRTGYPAFDFNTDRDQAAVGALLGEVTHTTLNEIGAMLSSLVVQKSSGDPGEGFYRLAKKLGALRPGVDKFEFFQAQVGTVHAHYSR